MAKSHKTCMEQAEIIDTLGTYQSSIPSSLVMVLMVADLELVVVVLLSGGCLGGGGSSKGLQVLRCALRFIEWNSFVEASRRSSGLSIPSLLTLHLAIIIVLVLAQL